MTERERLIDIIYNADNDCTLSWSEIIADNLLSNGVIVPPCKVGDTVYPKPSFGHTAPEKVTGIYIYEHFAAIKTTRDSFDFKDFGKKVFLTREAAMASIKEINVDPVTPIEDMGFSVRTYNCLKRADINTLQDLSERTVDDFQCVRNLGVKSLNEIIDRCKEYDVDIIAKELEGND